MVIPNLLCLLPYVLMVNFLFLVHVPNVLIVYSQVVVVFFPCFLDG